MKRNRKYVALDVHLATTVASVREESGRVIARSVLPAEEGALVEFFRGMRGSIQVVFEEGTQAQWLHDLLAPRVDRIIVCDRRGERRHGNKGDQRDADALAELLRRGGLRAVYHGSEHRAVLKELTRTYRSLVE
ncbi:MAG: transposase, partial [Gemmatimonadales bacterium]